MLRGAFDSRLMRMLLQRADSRAFPIWVGGGTVAVWSRPGAALGAGLLYLAFHHLGWARLFAAYPGVVRSSAWADATRWLAAYGMWAVFIIAATPLPLTSALTFAAISRLPIAEVVLALWFGKFAKYLVYAWLASEFPARALQSGQCHIEVLRAILARAVAGACLPRNKATPAGDRQ